MAKVRFTTYVPQEVLDELRLFSTETRVPAAQYVEEALNDLLNKYKDKKDATFQKIKK